MIKMRMMMKLIIMMLMKMMIHGPHKVLSNLAVRLLFHDLAHFEDFSLSSSPKLCKYALQIYFSLWSLQNHQKVKMPSFSAYVLHLLICASVQAGSKSSKHSSTFLIYDYTCSETDLHKKKSHFHPATWISNSPYCLLQPCRKMVQYRYNRCIKALNTSGGFQGPSRC